MKHVPSHRFSPQPIRVTLVLQGIVTLLYLVLFLVIHYSADYSTAVISSFIPVIVGGLLLGVRGGTIYALFIVAVNVLLATYLNYQVHNWGATLLGNALLLLCGIGAGRLRDQFAAQEDMRMRLAVSEERLHSMVTNAPVILFAIDPNGIFTLSEGSALATLGLQPGEAVGQSVFEMFAKAEDFLAEVRRALAGETFTSISRGRGVAFETRYTPQYDHNGQFIGTIGVSVNVYSRLQAEDAYRTLVETSIQGLVVLQDNRIVFANSAQAELTGYSIEALLAMTPEEMLVLTHPDDRELVASRFADLTAGKPLPRDEMRLVRKDGAVRWIELYSSVIEYQGKPAVQIAMLDVTERKQVEAALIEAERLQLALDHERELKELKSRFISMVSHQFRTPMSVISTTSYLLENYLDKLPVEKREDYFGKIRSQINRLDELIEKVLTISQAEAQELPFAPRSLDLEAFCREVSGEMQLISAGTHNLIFTAEGELSSVTVDDNLLRHILSNLLSNAIKYSPEGGDVRFHLEQQGGEAIFHIQDSGIGIPADDQKHLFEPFHRGQNVGAIKGSGLGLKIVKDFVDLHSGTITCQSEPGKGTTFTVRLPIHQPEAQARAQGAVEPTLSSGGA